MNAGDDTDDTDDLPLFGSFGSYSPQYRKHNSSSVQINFSQQYDDSINTSGGSGCGSPTPSLLSQSSNSSQNNNSNIANINAVPNINRVINTPQLRKLDVCVFII